MECVLEDARILIHEKKISSMKDCFPSRTDCQAGQAAFDYR